MFKRLYLSPLGILISSLLNLLGLFHRPFMVYGYWNRVTRTFNKRTRVSSTAVITDRSRLDLGDNCWIGHHSIIESSNGVKIGQGSQLAAWIGIFTHSSHLAIRLLGDKYIEIDKDDRVGYVRGPVEIGDYTFVGASSIILPNVVIGRGCLIAAGSVVKKSIPDFSIVAGNPAEVVGSTTALDSKFFDDAVVKASYFDLNVLDKCLKEKQS